MSDPSLAEFLKQHVKAEIARYQSNSDAAAHAIVWLVCRHAYAHGFVKGVECGKAYPNDERSGTLEEGDWFAGYDFADEAKLSAKSKQEPNGTP